MYSNHLNKTISTITSTEKVFLTDSELDEIALFLVGNHQRFREHIIIPRMIGPVQIKTNEEKKIENMMESCAFKSIMSCILGIYLLYFFIHRYTNSNIVMYILKIVLT